MIAMLEFALVIATLIAMGLSGAAAAALTVRVVTGLGLATLICGLVLAIPTGFWYHVVLYRLASAKTRLSNTWWLSPARLHVHLSGAEQLRIRPWYRIGGVGFMLSVAGGLVAIAGLLLDAKP
jgi:hypothetical protein